MTGRLIAVLVLVAAQSQTAAPVRAQAGAAKSDQKATARASATVTFPPTLPGNVESISTGAEREFLQTAATLLDGVAVAKTAPRVDFAYYPGQTYEGKPWSNWGNGSFSDGRYYSAIGDHLAPQGNAFVYEYNPELKSFRLLCDVRKLIQLPEGHYTPGKIHSHVMKGSDGWLYFTTHRGSTRVTTPANHFTGEWLLRADPATGRSEIIERGPIPHHCLPTGELDPKRMVFYGSTAPGEAGDGEGIQFLAYDLNKRKMLYAGPDGPSRSMLISSTTGRVYYVPGQGAAPLMRFDPASGKPPESISGEISIRAATAETPQGLIYVASYDQKGSGSRLYSFNVKTEQIEDLGPAAVGKNQYVAAIAADPSGQYLYYVPGAHGGSEVDHSAIVQFDTKRRTRKIIACLDPWFRQHAGCVLKGTYTAALDERGERMFVTWNISRGSKAWDCCGLTVIHIPESERSASTGD